MNNTLGATHGKELLALRKQITSAPKEYREIKLNFAYKMIRHGQTTTVYPIEVKKNKVVVKYDLNRKDSFTLDRNKFDQYYNLVV